MTDFGLSDGQANVLRWLVVVVGAVLIVVFLLRPLTFWWSTRYVFTDRRIIVRTGVLRKSGRDMPLSKLNNVSFSQTLIERMFSCGQLIVESAAESGNLVINNVPNIEYVQREIHTLHERDAERGRTPYQTAVRETQVMEAPTTFVSQGSNPELAGPPSSAPTSALGGTVAGQSAGEAHGSDPNSETHIIFDRRDGQA